MSKASETRVPCSEETRELLWQAKIGSESFDTLFRNMLEQYDPEKDRNAGPIEPRNGT